MTGPKLLLRLPEGESREIALQPRTSLGRHPGNSIQLADREVSKEHALIEQVGEQWVLRDLNSSNGCFVNGRRVEVLALHHGDELKLGRSFLQFLEGEKPPPTPPPVRPVTVIRSPWEAAVLAALKNETDEGFRPEGQIKDEQVLRRDYEKLRIAHDLGRQIGLERSEQALLDKILNFAFQVLPADHGVILLVNDKGELEPRATRSSEKGASEVAISSSVLARVQATRESVLIADAGSDVRFSGSESIALAGIRSAMAVPLMMRDTVRGVLFLDSRKRASAFLEKDLRLLSGIASQASLALERTELAEQIEQEAETRAHLSRFLSPALVEQARMGQIDLKRGGELTDVAVLFSDIRGFTGLSERAGPQETVRMLNEYFERMVDAVFRHGGVLDKFIGDALMAIWGAPIRRADDTERALLCAVEMQERLLELNRERVTAGREPIAIGIGVNAGDAVVGNMGSSKRLEYTVIGDTVNLASRLCHIAGPGEIIATQAVIGRTGESFQVQALPPTPVRGKTQPVPTVRVLGRR